MVNRMSKYIVYSLCKSSVMDMETLVYGCETLLSGLLNILSLLIIAYIFGALNYMVTFIIFFGALRLSAGGHHAPNYILCFIAYMVASFASIFVAFYTNSIIVFPYIFVAGIFSIFLVYRFAPTGCENRPLSSKEKAVFKKRSRFVIYVLFGAIVGLGFFNNHYALVAMQGVLVESITLIRLKRKESTENA